jgi:adenosylcobinamide-GDP ribazoletransferase
MRGLQTAIFSPLRCFSAALRFLTILPGLTRVPDEKRYFAGSAYYFTIVGLVSGVLIGGCALLCLRFAPPILGGVGGAIWLSLISGFLHLDGLADTIDGFMSCRDRERTLAIMKDSRIGVMGAAAVISLLLFKTAAILSLPANGFVPVIVVACAAGRTAAVLMMCLLPYARGEGGMGNLFFDGGSARSVSIISAVILLAAMTLLTPERMLAMIIGFVLTIGLLCWWCMRKIGGYTGDTLGAACELMETAILTGAVVSF